MRWLVLTLSLLAAPASAWTFSSSPVCTLSLDGKIKVDVTYDAGLGEYAIALTRPEGWPQGPVFALQFDGPMRNMITTGRHEIMGNTLTVRDRGFGNVLNGMSANFVATALVGGTAATFTLAGAKPRVDEFRACAQTIAA